MAKAVKSDTQYDDYNTDTHTVTTYDKLWLLSGREMFKEGSDSNDNKPIRLNEGELYQRADKQEITCSYYSQPKAKGYSEVGSSFCIWWLRSINRDRSAFSVIVNDSGNWNGNRASNPASGLAPGFCIK